MRLPNQKIAKLNKYLKPLNDYLIILLINDGKGMGDYVNI